MSKKGENIYKRKDNRWEARYIKGHGADGSVRYGYCYAKTYQEAKQKAACARANFFEGKILPSSDYRKRFAGYCDEWLQLTRSRITASSYEKYETAVEKHIKPGLGFCTMQNMTSVLIEQFGHRLLTEEALSAKTVRDILTIVHSIILYAQRQNASFSQHIEVVYPKDNRKELKILTREEQASLCKCLLDHMDPCKFGVMLAMLTGLRIGELCALQWKQISLEEKTLTVSSTMQRLKDYNDGSPRKTKIVISSPKSSMSARSIPLTEFAAELCRKQKVKDPAAFVLTGESKRYMEPRSLQYRFEKYTSECGLTGVHFHVLRHTFATRCVEVGFEIKSLSEILGHSNPKFTLERYVHSSMELKRSNMEKLASIGY